MKGMTKMTNFLPEVAEASASGGNQSSSMIFMILFYVAIFAALYFFLIRPNSKKKKEEAQLRNSLEKWCISTVDTVKEQSQQAGQPEKKGFFGFGKKKDSDESKTTKE